MSDEQFLEAALEQARIGRGEGGVPVGAALVVDGQVLAVGRNRRVQLGSAIRHGETDALENAGRQPAVGLPASHDGDDPVAVRHVHGGDPALRDPARGDRRCDHLPRAGGAVGARPASSSSICTTRSAGG